MPKRSFIGPVAMLALFVCVSAQAYGAQAAEVTVTIGNFVFTPASVPVHTGDKVTFVNGDDTIHSVQSDDGSFHSAGLDTGDKISFTFDHPGTFLYHCGLHPFMQGKIVVE